MEYKIYGTIDQWTLLLALRVLAICNYFNGEKQINCPVAVSRVFTVAVTLRYRCGKNTGKINVFG